MAIISRIHLKRCRDLSIRATFLSVISHSSTRSTGAGRERRGAVKGSPHSSSPARYVQAKMIAADK